MRNGYHRPDEPQTSLLAFFYPYRVTLIPFCVRTMMTAIYAVKWNIKEKVMVISPKDEARNKK